MGLGETGRELVFIVAAGGGAGSLCALVVPSNPSSCISSCRESVQSGSVSEVLDDEGSEASAFLAAAFDFSLLCTDTSRLLTDFSSIGSSGLKSGAAEARRFAFSRGLGEGLVDLRRLGDCERRLDLSFFSLLCSLDSDDLNADTRPVFDPLELALPLELMDAWLLFLAGIVKIFFAPLVDRLRDEPLLSGSPDEELLRFDILCVSFSSSLRRACCLLMSGLDTVKNSSDKSGADSLKSAVIFSLCWVVEDSRSSGALAILLKLS